MPLPEALPKFDRADVVSEGHPHYVAMMTAADREDHVNQHGVFSYYNHLYRLQGDMFPGCSFYKLITVYEAKPKPRKAKTHQDAFTLTQEDDERGPSYGWIQWKGTDVCIDIHCKCGAHLHFDGYFLYNARCAHCGKVYMLNPNVELIEVTEEKDPACTQTLQDEDVVREAERSTKQ